MSTATRDGRPSPTATGDVVLLSVGALADIERTMLCIAERGRAQVVVVTAGADGAYLLADGSIQHVPTVTPPAPVVDSNGAGDAFASGFLFGWLAGETPQRCALLGAVAGAHACTVPSTRIDPIGRDAVLAQAAAYVQPPAPEADAVGAA